MIFYHILKKHMNLNRGVSCLLFVGIVVCVYCISIMLGMAAGQYRLSKRSNTHATLTIDVGPQSCKEAGEISSYLKDMSKYGMVNILYFTDINEKSILIGWEGTKGSTWFPITSGRFFNENEQENGELVGFVSDNIEKESLYEGTFEIGANRYSIIGMGWIVPWSFAAAKSSRSNINVIGEGIDDREVKYMIIPFKCYAEEFEPKQIMAQFNNASHEDLVNYAKKIQDRFPDLQVYLPDNNSDDVLEDSTNQYSIIAMILCVIAGITVIRLMSEWIMTYKKEISVMWLCGMTKLRCMLMIYGHWLLYYCIGSIVAVFLQYISFPLLKFVYADAFPLTGSLLYILLVMFILSVICTINTMKEMLRLYTKEDVV